MYKDIWNCLKPPQRRKCARIQRIQIKLPSNHAIINFCQIRSANGKRRINMTCEGSRFFGSLLWVNCSRRRAKCWYGPIKRTENERWFDMACDWKTNSNEKIGRSRTQVILSHRVASFRVLSRLVHFGKSAMRDDAWQ